MKLSVPLKIILIIFFLSSSLFAQKEDEVEVSPTLNQKTIFKKCKNIDLGKVVFYHVPDYPPEARSAKIGGSVEVEIKIDEKGFVIGIINIKGHTLLQEAAKIAATKAKFTPTICDGQAAQVHALMIYNFIPYVITENYFTPTKIEDFLDITSDSVYYESILNLTENYKLAFAYGDRKFHSDAPLAKGDFAHFLRLTLDFLNKRAEIANKNPQTLELFSPYNPNNIKSANDIKDLNDKLPYSDSVNLLLSKYKICLADENKKFNGKFPLTNNEVINYWENIFGKEAVPVNFKKINDSDKILTRGEFSLFLQESLYVLTYKVLP